MRERFKDKKKGDYLKAQEVNDVFAVCRRNARAKPIGTGIHTDSMVTGVAKRPAPVYWVEIISDVLGQYDDHKEDKDPYSGYYLAQVRWFSHQFDEWNTDEEGNINVDANVIGRKLAVGDVLPVIWDAARGMYLPIIDSYLPVVEFLSNQETPIAVVEDNSGTTIEFAIEAKGPNDSEWAIVNYRSHSINGLPFEFQGRIEDPVYAAGSAHWTCKAENGTKFRVVSNTTIARAHVQYWQVGLRVSIIDNEATEDIRYHKLDPSTPATQWNVVANVNNVLPSEPGVDRSSLAWPTIDEANGEIIIYTPPKPSSSTNERQVVTVAFDLSCVYFMDEDSSSSSSSSSSYSSTSSSSTSSSSSSSSISASSSSLSASSSSLSGTSSSESSVSGTPGPSVTYVVDVCCDNGDIVVCFGTTTYDTDGQFLYSSTGTCAC